MIAQQAERGNKIDALLATLGGQTALNTAVALYENGALERYGVELIGADFDAIQRGEDRQRFKDIVAKVGGESARSRVCFTMDEVRETVDEVGLPVVVRPSFTMGGLGSGMARSVEEVDRMAGAGLAASPSANVLIEESIYGWKEFELELMRDGHDNVVVVCSIENVDPMGVHTGDSVTVAPAMTLTDREYQRMRDLGIAILREVGVDTGGCNIQFAVNPADGRLIVVEMNPAGIPVQSRWRPRPPASRSPRSPPSWPSATPSTRSSTTSPRKRRPASNPRWTTSWSRRRGSRSRSSPAPTPP